MIEQMVDSPIGLLRACSGKIPFRIYNDSKQVSQAVAKEIADLIRERNEQGKKTVLGLATGSSPVNVYSELVRMHQEEGLTFANVITFNLDEYYPMQPDCLQSYVRFMNEHLFDLIDIPRDQVNIPDGTVDSEKIAQYCNDYEQKIADVGGIDIQLLGIGRTGHIGFNEPGSGTDSRTRTITLDGLTRVDAASDFFGALKMFPAARSRWVWERFLMRGELFCWRLAKANLRLSNVRSKVK